jgi:hypothetical protein
MPSPTEHPVDGSQGAGDLDVASDVASELLGGAGTAVADFIELVVGVLIGLL